MKLIGSAAVLLSALGAGLDCRAQTVFRALGSIPSAADAVSADGSTVVGEAGGQAFRWRVETGLIRLGHLPSPYDIESVAWATSADGSVVVGYDTFFFDPEPHEAFRWTEETGMVRLGLPPDPDDFAGTGALGVAPDGSFAVGFSGARGVKWVGDDPNPVQIPSFTNAWAVSLDARTIVGVGLADGINWTALRWSADLGTLSLGDLPGGAISGGATAVSANGRVIVGGSISANSAPNNEEAFRWTPETGMVGLGDLPGGFFYSVAQGVSGDGRIVVGNGYETTINPIAFVWDPIHGMRDLRQVLIDEYQVDITAWPTIRANAISADGRTIVGIGTNPQGNGEAWMVYLDPPLLPPCPADFNADAALNSQDFFDFLQSFFTADLAADFNHDGSINSQDFFDYLAAFFAGC